MRLNKSFKKFNPFARGFGSRQIKSQSTSLNKTPERVSQEASLVATRGSKYLRKTGYL
jgi:hypothetical protein